MQEQNALALGRMHYGTVTLPDAMSHQLANPDHENSPIPKDAPEVKAEPENPRFFSRVRWHRAFKETIQPAYIVLMVCIVLTSLISDGISSHYELEHSWWRVVVKIGVVFVLLVAAAGVLSCLGLVRSNPGDEEVAIEGADGGRGRG